MGLAAQALDELDPVHVSVQPDPAARRLRPVRLHEVRASHRAADSRGQVRGRTGVARRACLPDRSTTHRSPASGCRGRWGKISMVETETPARSWKPARGSDPGAGEGLLLLRLPARGSSPGRAGSMIPPPALRDGYLEAPACDRALAKRSR